MATQPEVIANLMMAQPGWVAGNVLDIRTAADFRTAHLTGAVSVPIPGSETVTPAMLDIHLPSIYLPPRHEALLVVGNSAHQAESAAVHLQGRGRKSVTGLGWPEIQGLHPSAEWLEKGSSSAHLWNPGEWLVQHAHLLPPPPSGPVLDVACGSGRAAVWLAERGYSVTGLDWQPEALELGRRLAADRDTRVRFLRRDLRRADALPEGPWSVLLNFRFLQRDLFERWARMVAPGGLVLLRTFREAPGYTGHPRPRYRLARGELLRRFPAGLWDILAHAEDHDPDGRPAAGIVARRRG